MANYGSFFVTIFHKKSFCFLYQLNLQLACYGVVRCEDISQAYAVSIDILESIDFSLMAAPLDAPAGDIRPVLFAGVQTFFKAEISLMHNFPNREVADCQAAVVQLLSFLKWRSTARRTRPTSSASATSSPRPHGTRLLAWIHRSGTVAPHPEVPAPARTTVSSSNKWRVVRRQTRPALSTKTSASRR